MRHLLTNVYYLDHPKQNSCGPTEFSKKENDSEIQEHLTSLTTGSDHQPLYSLQMLLENKFMEWSRKTEEVQSRDLLLEKDRFEEKLKHLTRLLDNVFQLFITTVEQDCRLEKNLADLIELLLQDTNKFDDLPELSQEDLKILGDFKTILPPTDWKEVMDDACELLGDPGIMKDAVAEFSAYNHSQSKRCYQIPDDQDNDIEQITTLMRNCSI